jgi:hypothetical protein
MPSISFMVAAATVALAALHAQGPIVFVGTSVGGSTDAHFFVDVATGGVVNQSGNTFTDNVTDAVWTGLGTRLYVSQSIQPRVSLAQWNGTTPTWSNFYNAPGACYGLGHDAARHRLWVLTGPSGSTRELVCLDADPASAGYGTVIVQTTSLTGPSRERWELSPSGNLAAVPHVFIQSGLFQLVDTDPGSPTFLQIVASAPVPNLAASTLAIVSDCAIRRDDQYAFVLYSGVLGSGGSLNGLAMWHVPTGQWVDFDPATPGVQNFNLPLPVANAMDLSYDGSFAVVSGQGGGGWVGRVDIDYVNPANTTFTQFTVAQGVPNCNAVSLAPDGSRLAVSATPVNLASPSYLAVLDVTGATLSYTQLSGAWNVYTTAWQDLAGSFVPFGHGCSGVLGEPVLAAAPGSLPTVGQPFTVQLTNVPIPVAFFAAGLSNTASGGVPLPVDLGLLGMPGCPLLVDPMFLDLDVSGTAAVSHVYQLPNQSNLVGLLFYVQGFPIDGSANTMGIIASNGGTGRIGL